MRAVEGFDAEQRSDLRLSQSSAYRLTARQNPFERFSPRRIGSYELTSVLTIDGRSRCKYESGHPVGVKFFAKPLRQQRERGVRARRFHQLECEFLDATDQSFVVLRRLD